MLYFSCIRVKKKPPHRVAFYNLTGKFSYKISSKRATGDTSKPEINP